MVGERERLPIEERPEEFSDLNIEQKEEIQAVPTNFTAKVKDDSGNDLLESPAIKTVTIQLPSTQTSLISWAKGNIVNSVTWFAVWWLRMIKKALHFGWKIINRP